MTRTTVSKWDARFMELARHVAGWSKDPSTKVGAVIVNDRLQVVGMGYNGFPRGTSDSGALYEDRERKYLRVVHAEVNAVLNATQSCMGATVYVTHPCCAQCMGVLIQAGVLRVVFPAADDGLRERLGASFDMAAVMAREAGVRVWNYSEGAET